MERQGEMSSAAQSQDDALPILGGHAASKLDRMTSEGEERDE